jgi:hypothetical protein
VWLTFFFVYFQFQPPYFGFAFFQKRRRTVVSGFLFPTQILAVERNFASASAQVLAED